MCLIYKLVHCHALLENDAIWHSIYLFKFEEYGTTEELSCSKNISGLNTKVSPGHGIQVSLVQVHRYVHLTSNAPKNLKAYFYESLKNVKIATSSY